MSAKTPREAEAAGIGFSRNYAGRRGASPTKTMRCVASDSSFGLGWAR
jgi:hypothetical protein